MSLLGSSQLHDGPTSLSLLIALHPPPIFFLKKSPDLFSAGVAVQSPAYSGLSRFGSLLPKQEKRLLQPKVDAPKPDP